MVNMSSSAPVTTVKWFLILFDVCVHVAILTFYWSSDCVCARARMCVCVRERERERERVRVRVRVHARMYVCMYVCMYVYIYIYIQGTKRGHDQEDAQKSN